MDYDKLNWTLLSVYILLNEIQKWIDIWREHHK